MIGDRLRDNNFFPKKILFNSQKKKRFGNFFTKSTPFTVDIHNIHNVLVPVLDDDDDDDDDDARIVVADGEWWRCERPAAAAAAVFNRRRIQFFN